MYLFKNKIIYNFMKCRATKKGKTNNFSRPFCCCCWIWDHGLEIPYPGSKIRDPVSGIRDGKKGSGVWNKHPGSAALRKTITGTPSTSR
jgi:hypothetical protein